MSAPMDAGAVPDAINGMTLAGLAPVARRVGACLALMLVAAALAYVFSGI